MARKKKLSPQEEFMAGCDVVARTDPGTAAILRQRYWNLKAELLAEEERKKCWAGIENITLR